LAVIRKTVSKSASRSGSRSKKGQKPKNALSNARIAELLAEKAETAPPPLNRAFRRAARRAFLWPIEAAELRAAGKSLQELSGVGPYIEKLLVEWFKKEPSIGVLPAVRSDFLTWTEAQAILAKNPAIKHKLRGDLQMHSEWSDGTASIAEMADAATALHYEYIAITDHAKKLKIAGGIDEKELRDQGREIAEVNENLKRQGKSLRVLRSIELNLNPRGEGDMEIVSLAELDIVLGCFHSSLRHTEDQTERYLAALRNPSLHILGHPRGRIFNHRLGLQADWARVFAHAASLDKAVEIDCYPDRQDLNLELVKLARKQGCRLSLGTDSHGPSQLRFIDFGLATAVAAGLEPSRILNLMSREQLLGWVGSLRAAQS
jgi:putative hydrolase